MMGAAEARFSKQPEQLGVDEMAFGDSSVPDEDDDDIFSALESKDEKG